MTQQQHAAPGAPPADRITGLDVTRGFAVMGILTMNIVSFALPEMAYISPLAWGQPGAADVGSWALSFLLFDGKLRGLFSMMFGASTLLVADAAVRAGRSPARSHYARMVTLALFGLAHFYLLWWGDILFHYAVVGMAIYPLRHLDARRLATIGAMAIAANALGFGMTMTSFRSAALAQPASDTGKSYAGLMAQFTPADPAAQREVAVMRGGYAGILDQRMRENGSDPLVNLGLWGLETFGLMLIGMALYTSGLLRGDWSAARCKRWAARAICFGLFGNAVLLAWQLAEGLDPWLLLVANMAFSVPFDVATSVGYAALAMWLAQRFAAAPLIARIAATGRAAFSNYLGTSLLMTFIFYGYGLGLFGHVPRAGLWPFVFGAWGLMLLWSKPWLDRFRYGPMEWLWRSMARGRLQPLRT